MPGTPARAGGVLAGSGVLANIVAGTGLAVLAGGATLSGAAVLAWTATPALARTGQSPVPVTVHPSTAMPSLPVTVAISCNAGARSATLYGKEIGMTGPVSMKPTRQGVFAVTVRLPAALKPGVYTVVAGCENGDYGTANLTVQVSPEPSQSPAAWTPPPSSTARRSPAPASPAPAPLRSPPPRPKPCHCYPTAAPVTGDGSTSFPGGMSGATLAGLSLLGAGGLTGVAVVRRVRRSRR